MPASPVSYEAFVSGVLATIVRNNPFRTVHEIRSKLSDVLGERDFRPERLGLGSLRCLLLRIPGMSIYGGGYWLPGQGKTAGFTPPSCGVDETEPDSDLDC
ncbi:hypothetical protein ABEB36_009283 [Hypothenemus hampei]|uniref:Uncharacterized protein n=1 Tax=Hypothenemus hampei TaxID=57062 RepID=A0ABD1E121_HYPHA